MDFISSKEAAVLWGISQSRVVRLAGQGRISGAVLVGKSWLIPKNASKPADGRTKTNEPSADTDSYHFPYLYLRDYSASELAALSIDEQTLLKASLLYEKGGFSDSRDMLEELRRCTDDPVIRFGATYVLCYIYIYQAESRLFEQSVAVLNLMLQDDLPHKDELRFLLREVEIFSTGSRYFTDSFHIAPQANYSELARIHLVGASVYSRITKTLSENADFPFDEYELLCHSLEENRYHFIAMCIHIYLSLAYSMKGDKEISLSHMHSAIDIGLKGEFYVSLSHISLTCKTVFDDALNDYPEETASFLREKQSLIYSAIQNFLKPSVIKSRLETLTFEDYALISYALHGLYSKEISSIENTSENSINKHYARIYNKLKVSGKKEMVKMFRELIKDHSSFSK